MFELLNDLDTEINMAHNLAGIAEALAIAEETGLAEGPHGILTVSPVPAQKIDKYCFP